MVVSTPEGRKGSLCRRGPKRTSSRARWERFKRRFATRSCGKTELFSITKRVPRQGKSHGRMPQRRPDCNGYRPAGKARPSLRILRSFAGISPFGRCLRPKIARGDLGFKIAALLCTCPQDREWIGLFVSVFAFADRVVVLITVGRLEAARAFLLGDEVGEDLAFQCLHDHLVFGLFVVVAHEV